MGLDAHMMGGSCWISEFRKLLSEKSFGDIHSVPLLERPKYDILSHSSQNNALGKTRRPFVTSNGGPYKAARFPVQRVVNVEEQP